MWDVYGSFYPSSLKRPCPDVKEGRKVSKTLCVTMCPFCVDRECKTGMKIRKEM